MQFSTILTWLESMILLKRIFSTVIILLAFCVQSTCCQVDDLQPAMHTLVEAYPYGDTKGARWETDKKKLAGHSPEQLVRALIVEVDLDRGSPINNLDRDVAASRLFTGLDLPPTLICQELDKPQVPQRKASLMIVLRDSKSPVVTQALLRQLGDLRPAVEPRGFTEVVKPHALRVRDMAYNTLVDNLDVLNPQKVKMHYKDTGRDRIIRETLAQLKLTSP